MATKDVQWVPQARFPCVAPSIVPRPAPARELARELRVSGVLEALASLGP
jgi:hypothetical protein